MGKLSRENVHKIDSMKTSYKEAKASGDKEEESRWANQIGHAYKDKGEYVEALKWFRIDYDIASGRKASGKVSPANLMPTCQSLGEMYLRLQDYDAALIYQERHYELAKEAQNLVEQQRASTQLGRTYLDIYENGEGISTFTALQKCQEFFKISMELAKDLTENPASRDSASFVKELVDAYNNLGLMKMVTEDSKQAEKFFRHGLRICREEELAENDDARSRIHHNLGRLYCERRDWPKAMEHMQLDIKICNFIQHTQGEAKGLINLGELYFKQHLYENAMQTFRRALDIAETLEDEDTLVNTAKQNIRVVNEAKQKMDELLAGEQKLKKLQRVVESSKGKSSEMNLLKQEYKLLGELISQAEALQAWDKHLYLSKRQKVVSRQLGDAEKIGDAFGTIGHAYYNLREFEKAKKWFLKGWEMCKRAKHLEGQSVAKINYGNALDANGEWDAALQAYKEAFELAALEGKTKMVSQQISALENMQYAYTVRLENLDAAREIESRLKELRRFEDDRNVDDQEEHCSETDSEAADEPIDLDSSTGCFPSGKWTEENVASKLQAPNNRKRQRIILSDDEEDVLEVQSFSNERLSEDGNSAAANRSLQGPAISGNLPEVIEVHSPSYSQPAAWLKTSSRKLGPGDLDCLDALEDKDAQPIPAAKSIPKSKAPESETSGSSRKIQRSSGRPSVHKCSTMDELSARCEDNEVVIKLNDSKHAQVEVDVECQYDVPCSTSHVIPVSIDGHVVHVDSKRFETNNFSWLLEELVRRYKHVKPEGPYPVLKGLTVRGKALTSVANLYDELSGAKSDDIAALIAGWMKVPFVERYKLQCLKYNSNPNLGLIHKMNVVNEGEIDARDCDLYDMSVWPLLLALDATDTFSTIKLAHNNLGSSTINALQGILSETKNKNIGLALDYHNNKLSANALFEMCKCHVTLSRLEVLILSGNNLTDRIAHDLAFVMEKSPRLQILELEECGLTTPTFESLRDALQPQSRLRRLSIGKNSPITGHALKGLFEKLSTLPSFTDLDISSVQINFTGMEGIVQLIKTSSTFSVLLMKRNHIRAEGWELLNNAIKGKLPQLQRIDLTDCQISPEIGLRLYNLLMAIPTLLILSLGGNCLYEQAVHLLTQELGKPECQLEKLDLSNCHIEQPGVLSILESLQGNSFLVELNLAANCLEIKSSGFEKNGLTEAVACEGDKSMLDQVSSKQLSDDVADSEDEEPLKNELLDTEAQAAISSDSIFIQKLARAISLAGSLKFLDLSNTGFIDSDSVDKLSKAWAASSRRRLHRQHIEKEVVHLYVEGITCCTLRACCS